MITEILQILYGSTNCINGIQSLQAARGDAT